MANKYIEKLLPVHCPRCGSVVAERIRTAPPKNPKTYYFSQWEACSSGCGYVKQFEKYKISVNQSGSCLHNEKVLESLPLTDESENNKETKKETPLEHIEIFCDGACSGNPGPGGFGAIMRSGSSVKELAGSDPHTTNNRMELLGAITALEALSRPCAVTLTSDSQYLVKGMTEWIHGWIKKGWINSKKEPVVNRDLWERLLLLAKTHRIDWKWVKGHDGHAENERCDELARGAISSMLLNDPAVPAPAAPPVVPVVLAALGVLYMPAGDIVRADLSGAEVELKSSFLKLAQQQGSLWAALFTLDGRHLAQYPPSALA